VIAGAFCLATIVTNAQSSATSYPNYVARGCPRFGMVVGRAGDVDGDGVPDLIVGDPGHRSLGSPPAYWTLSGKDGRVLHSFALEKASFAGFHVEGAAGFGVGAAPDVLLSECGVARLVSYETGVELRLPGPDAGWSGSRAQRVGDFDQDGISDVAVIASRPGDWRASVVVCSGLAGSPIAEVPLLNVRRGTLAGLADVGDIDGDGTHDLAVVGNADPGYPASLRVYSTAKRTTIWEHHSARSLVAAYCVLAVLDGVGGEDARLVVSFDDRVDVLGAKSGRLLFRLEPSTRSDCQQGFGRALAPLGDVDRDGETDFAMSATEDGLSQGSVRVASGRNGAILWQQGDGMWKPGELDAYHLGWQLAAIGDVDGDRICDLLVGSCEQMSGQPGLARVLSGVDGRELFEFSRRDGVVLARKSASKSSVR
jgi:hypothetical protein